MALVHCFHLGDVAFGEPEVHVLVVDVLLLLGLEYRSGSFIFLVYFYLFLAMCIRTVIRVLRCCRGWV
jgi:hypothetical protein